MINYFVARQGFEHLTFDSLKGMLVGVHWNAHKNTFSIVEMKSMHTVGKVIGYSDYITLNNCYAHISKSEQKKVQNGSVKTRHAFICGYIDSFDINVFSRDVYYNPKKVNTFVDGESFLKGNVIELESMEGVAMAKVPSKNIPMVTYNQAIVKKLPFTS